MKLNRLTIHDPGHSSLESGGDVGAGGGVVVVGLLVVGLGLCVTGTLVLSQQTDPLLQFDVL